jgi:hypothetical protein
MTAVMAWSRYSFFKQCKERGDPLPGIRAGSVPAKFLCTAKSKRTGKGCQCPRVKGQKVCRHHGAQGLKPTRAKLLRAAARLRGERPAHYTVD